MLGMVGKWKREGERRPRQANDHTRRGESMPIAGRDDRLAVGALLGRRKNRELEVFPQGRAHYCFLEWRGRGPNIIRTGPVGLASSGILFFFVPSSHLSSVWY